MGATTTTMFDHHINNITTSNPGLYFTFTNNNNNNNNNNHNHTINDDDNNDLIHNMTEDEIQNYLAHLQEEDLPLYLPAICFILLVALVGLIGNVLVLMVYKSKRHKTPTMIFIMAIAGFDLIANVICIPGDVYEMFNAWNFTNSTLCRLVKYAKAASTITSAFILLALSIARYRKICLPFRKQVTVRHAQRMSFGIAIFGWTASIPYGIIYGKHSKATPRPGVNGYECSISDAYFHTIWPLINNGFTLLIFISLCIPLMVLYTLVWIQAYKHRKFHKTFASKGKVGQGAAVTSTPLPSSTGDNSEKTKRNDSNSVLSNVSNKKKLFEIQKPSTYKNVIGCCNFDFVICCKDKDNESDKSRAICKEEIRGNSADTGFQSRSAVETDINVLNDCLETTDDSFLNYNEILSIGNQNCSNDESKNQGETKLSEECDSIPSNVASENKDDGCSRQTVDLTNILYKSDISTTDTEDNNSRGTVSRKISLSEKASKDNILHQNQGHPHESLTDETRMKREDDKDDDKNEKKYDENMVIDSSENEGEIICEIKDFQNNKRRRSSQLSICENDINTKRKDFESKKDCTKSSQNSTVINKTTAMLFIISLVYILSYVPYLSLFFFRFTQPDKFEAMNQASLVAHHIFHRSYFINSAANAIIYSLCDKRFRQEVVKLFKCQK